jgi:dihydrolipoamide dehydrogenase
MSPSSVPGSGFCPGEEVSAELHKAYADMGVKILTSTRVNKMEDTGSSVKVTVTGADGKEQVLEAEKALQAMSFTPNIEGYGLEKTGVELTERKAIAINGFMQTNVPHLYAIGDVTAKLMLAHVAEAMAIVAAEHIAGEETIELDFIMMPRATYCHPQVASFGYTEKEAQEAGFEINTAKFPLQANGKRLGLGDSTGFVKLISDKTR